MATDTLAVHHNEQEQRFEVAVDGLQSVLGYVRHDNLIIFTHTEVPPELEGRGIAGRMAQVALGYARDQSLRVVPRCPFVAAYIRRHPEYQALVYEPD